MWHYTVLQNGPDGPWHYVSAHYARGAHPTEGCTPSCDHPTPDDAYEHHRQWIINNVQLDHQEPDALRRCEECGEYTARRVLEGDGYRLHVLCDAHATSEVVERRYYPPGYRDESWRS